MDDRNSQTAAAATAAAALIFAFVCFAGLLQLATNAVPPSDYILVSWKWDYRLGLAKRALPGELLGHIIQGRSPAFVLELSIGLFVAYLVLFARMPRP